MRITIQCHVAKPTDIAIDYRYQLSSWIYKMINAGDSVFGTWLHDQGYRLNGKKYKLFCYSDLSPQSYDRHDRVLRLLPGPMSCTISFLLPDGVKNLVKGVFQNQSLDLRTSRSDARFRIEHVALATEPIFAPIMRYRAVSPILISKNRDADQGQVRGNKQFLEVTDPDYNQFFAQNLVNKANAYLSAEKYSYDQVGLAVLSDSVKGKMHSIKGIAMKGKLFDFELSAPTELMKIGYYAGFGGANSSLGFGMCSILKK